MKKAIYIIGSIIVVLALLISLSVYLATISGGSPTAGNIGENAWICKNRQWLKSGNPITPKPPIACTIEGQKYQWQWPTSPPPGIAGNAQESDLAGLIMVLSPRPNDIINSGFEVKGEAVGNWYFEASFPVRLVDANGKILAETAAQAQGDWMTGDLVPFSAKLGFAKPETKTGLVILQNDNPSGLPENQKELKVPVNFGDGGMVTLKVYFGNSKVDPNAEECDKVYAVDRQVDHTAAVARAALEELLQGPTVAEKSQGFFTSINNGVKINSLTIDKGLASVDFDKQLEEAVGGSCRVAAISAQITQTLRQFPTVQNIIISIDGRAEDILQP
jgi:hypothetical protein